MSTIGSRIRDRREELGLSQDELGKRLGYKSRSSINKIELDQRNLTQSKIKAIADALDTTPAYIMGWNEPDITPMGETSKRIQNALQNANISYEELSARTGIPESTLQRYVAGKAEKIPTERLIKISLALDVSPLTIADFDTASEIIAMDLTRKDIEGNKEQPAELNLDELSPTKRYLIDAINRLPEDQLQVLAAVIDQVMHGRGE